MATQKAESENLISYEKIDRASPDLWPEQIPGVSEFAATNLGSPKSTGANIKTEVEKEDDIDMIQELGSLTSSQLLEKVRGLQNLAYQLGLEESREMTRGKFLKILDQQRKS